MIPQITIDACDRLMHKHILRKGTEDLCRDNVPRWMGHKVIKFPNDLILYQQELYQLKPDVLVETGTRYGGSALFYANMFDLLGKGQVITVDVRNFPKKPIHPRITYLIGESIDEAIVGKIKELVKGKSCMVTLDSRHDGEYVKKEIDLYHSFVTLNQYLVVEDAYKKVAKVISSFLVDHSEFKQLDATKQFLIHTTVGGWLKRIKNS